MENPYTARSEIANHYSDTAVLVDESAVPNAFWPKDRLT